LVLTNCHWKKFFEKTIMTIKNLLIRIVEKYHRSLSYQCCRRMVAVKLITPIISFSFDDAPRTAFRNGGDILKAHGVRGTYFLSLGMLGTESPSGIIASKDDLHRAVEEGHELGCHTFDHKDSWKTKAEVFEQSVLKNRQELAIILPDTVFSSFAYPLCNPSPANKRRMGKLFNFCRGGGQTLNVGMADLNLLKAFFLDVRNGDTIDTVRRLVDRNAESRGWLIFATHDVTENPSPYGCTKAFLEEVVAYSSTSGAHLLPIGEVIREFQSSCFQRTV
jgi:peptidoglycan/xylan/chitin deacetylase (PgdA/CDA1 family)